MRLIAFCLASLLLSALLIPQQRQEQTETSKAECAVALHGAPSRACVE
ncbi:hypothetical protein RN629_08330 [Sphingomonadaceae bacterium jetA1]|jgi:hypothetical protein